MSQHSGVLLEGPRGRAEMWRGCFQDKGVEDEPSDCVAGVKRKPRTGAGAAFRKGPVRRH